MKKIACLLLTLLAINTSYSEEWAPQYYTPEAYAPEYDYDYGVYDAYRYCTVGVGPFVFIPNLGVGYRERHCRLGWDANLSFSSLGYAHQVSGTLVGHYYLDPYAQNSPYVGLGLLGSYVFTNKKGGFGTLSPDFVIGKEFEKTDSSCITQFIEMHVGVPTFIMEKNTWKMGAKEFLYFPAMYIKYGFSF